MTKTPDPPKLNAADRIELARTLGARIIANPGPDTVGPEACAATLLRAAEMTNRNLGLTPDTPEQAAQRERERQERVLACLAAVRAGVR